MEIGGFALRDVILAASGLVGVYLIVMLLRLVQVGRHKDAVVDAVPAQDESVADEEDDDDAANDEAVVYAKPQPVAAEEARSFGAELTRSQLEREVKQLREEVAALRTELNDIKAANRVSPQYADAMALVQRGLTAQDVADRCDISLGEAELVWALARGPQFDEEDDHGFDSGRTHARTA